MMLRYYFLIIYAGFSLITAKPGQSQQVDFVYYKAYEQLNAMLEGKQDINFKKAVFITENAYVNNSLIYEDFCDKIDFYKYICQRIIQSHTISYREPDSANVNIYAAIFKFMTDTIPILMPDSTLYNHLPFTYNFDDYAGQTNWANTFVSCLINTHKGNCHSLPMLYKIIAEEMGAPAWLAMAPNHCYIKLYNKQNGWYNTELTSGEFPADTWLMVSGYIHLDAVRNGIYMDTLSLKQSLAFCLLDLAHGYQHKYNSENAEFTLLCCETALKYYPNYINALLAKARILAQMSKNKPQDTTLKSEVDNLYAHIHKLGYRQMSQEMYMKWILSAKNKEYRNNQVHTF